jgi:hypothetical protein
LSEEKTAIALSVFELCQANTRKALDEYDTVKVRRDKLRSRIRWVGRKTQESSQGVDAVYSAISNALKGIFAKIEEYEEKAKQLRERLGSVNQDMKAKE